MWKQSALHTKLIKLSPEQVDKLAASGAIGEEALHSMLALLFEVVGTTPSLIDAQSAAP